MRILPKYVIIFLVGFTFFLYQVAMAYCSLHDPSTHIDAGSIIFIHTDAQKPSFLPFLPQSLYHVTPPEFAGSIAFPAEREPSHARDVQQGLLPSRAPPPYPIPTAAA